MNPLKQIGESNEIRKHFKISHDSWLTRRRNGSQCG